MNFGKRRRFLDIDDTPVMVQALNFPMGRINRYYGMNKKPKFPVGSFVRWKTSQTIFEVVGDARVEFGESRNRRQIRCLTTGHKISLMLEELEAVSALEALGEVAE
jgi:hypothetical protein